jgi:hypothetical protein
MFFEKLLARELSLLRTMPRQRKLGVAASETASSQTSLKNKIRENTKQPHDPVFADITKQNDVQKARQYNCRARAGEP